MPAIPWDASRVLPDLMQRADSQRTVMPEPDEESPDLMDVAASAARLSSVFASTNNVIARASDMMAIFGGGYSDGTNRALYTPDFEDVKGWSPYSDPEALTGLSPDQYKLVSHVNSPDELKYAIRSIHQEQRDLDTVAKGGIPGQLMTAAFFITDAPAMAAMLVPAAAPVAWGSRLTRVAAATGAVAAVDTAAEVALHRNQYLRTLEQSMTNVGAGVFLGAALGTWVSRVPRSEFEKIAGDLQKGFDAANKGKGVPQGSTAGSAEVELFGNLDDNTIAKGGEAVARTVGKINPLNRVLTSSTNKARVLLQRMADIPFMLNKNLKGVPTAGSVEAAIKQRSLESRMMVVTNFDDEYAKYVARVGSEAMSRREFGITVAGAMRRGDKSDITEVSGLARTIRKQFEADRKAFEDLEVLPEDIGTLGAESYFPRVYDHNAILANRPDFFNRIYRWFIENPQVPKESSEVKAARGRVGDVVGDSFANVEETLAKSDAAKAAAKESVDALESIRRQRTAARSDISRAEAALAEADKTLIKVEEAWGRAEGNAAAFAEKKKAYDNAKETVASAEAEVASAKKKLAEHNAAIRKAEREVDGLQQTLNELEAQREYLPEEASGATPQQLARAQRRLTREIEKTTVKGIAHGEKLQTLRDEAIELEQGMAALHKARKDATEASRTAEKELDEVNAVRKKDARTAEAVDRWREKKAKAEEAVAAARKGEDDVSHGVAAQRAAAKEARLAAKEAKKAADAAKADARAVRDFEASVADAKSAYRDPVEIESRVNETIDRILGTTRAAADLGHISNPRPTKMRTLDVPDHVIEPYLVSALDQVMSGYIRSVAPNIEMRKAFGSIDLAVEKKEISDAYGVLLHGAKDDAKATARITKEHSDVLNDIEGMRLRLLNQVGPKGSEAVGWVRTGRILRQFNMLRMLGTQTVSSMADLGHIVSKYGLRNTGKALAKFVTNVKFNKLTRADSRRMHVALDWILDTRSGTLADIAEDLSGGQRGFAANLERVGQRATQQFTRLSLMATWNSTLKNLTSILEQDAILRGAANPSSLSKIQRAKIAQLGLGESDLKVIAEQFAKHGETTDGMLRASTELWDKEALGVARKLESAIIQAGEIMSISKGVGDTPFMMDRELVKTLLQFKTFGVVSVNRLMIPVAQGLAHGDMMAANGLGVMLGLGALSQYTKDIIAGREPETDPASIVSSALLWSGALGYIPDLSDPATVFMPGPLRELKLSRFKDSSPLDTLMGPSFGTATDFITAWSGLVKPADEESWAPDVSASDIHRVRRLWPLQNLAYIYRPVNALEGEFADLIDAEGATYDTFYDRLTESKPAK